jgi:type IV pilus assembly protein PilO
MRLTEMLKQLWKSHRSSLILLGALLVLNLLLFTALERWVFPRVTEQESRFLQRQTEVRRLLHKQGSTATTPAQLYALASQDLSRFQQAVPDYQEFTGLIEELLVLSNRANLNITQISYRSEGLPGNLLLKFDLNFNVAGDYKQIKKFIHSLEQSVRLITINQISLQSADNDGVSLRLSLETFFRSGSRES